MATISPGTKSRSLTARFRLYVAGEAPNSTLALQNLRAICQDRYGDDYQIDIIDVLLSPERAWAAGVIVTPMVVRDCPVPTVQIIGNLSNKDQALSVLGFEAEGHG
jgi:circadian clock protein KaiB